eukprot:SAG31_NODE_9203_length_1317_cov_1.030378_2_plen_172_part_00
MDVLFDRLLQCFTYSRSNRLPSRPLVKRWLGIVCVSSSMWTRGCWSETTQQQYDDLCTASGFESVVTGEIHRNSPSDAADYCVKCIVRPSPLSTSQDHEFDIIMQNTGWSNLVVFTSCAPRMCNWQAGNMGPYVDGGVVNSRRNGGYSSSFSDFQRAWAQPLHPLCGRENV